MTQEMLNLPHTSGVEAAVNAPATVVLFDEGGKDMTVNVVDEPYWLAKGFTREKLDPAQAEREFGVACDALKQAVAAYTAEVLKAGKIDHGSDGSRFAAHMAMREVEGAWHLLVRAIDATFPSLEKDPVAMIDDKGATVFVDPGQVELYRASGWEVKG